MASAAVVQQGGQDLSSLLSQVKVLESDRERLARELEEARRKIEEEQRRLEEVNSKMGRLTEGKRAEMQQAFDTVIKKWLADSVQDEKVRQEFQTGMSRLVENTAEDSGVWQVVCCASNLHARRLQEIDQLQQEINTLKSAGAGEFREESSRKRGRDEAHPGGRQGEPKDIWLDFEECMKGRTFDPAL